jgi:hypothetical protein
MAISTSTQPWDRIEVGRRIRQHHVQDSLFLLLLLLVTMCCSTDAARPTRTAIGRDEVNVLMGSDAHMQGGITERYSGDHVHRLWMENWASTDDSFTWHLYVPPECAGDYHVRLLASSHFKMASGYDGGSSPVTVELRVESERDGEQEGPGQATRESAQGTEQGWAGSGAESGGKAVKEESGRLISRVEHEIAYQDGPVMMQLDRLFVLAPLRLPPGPCRLALRALHEPEEGAMNLQLLSVELAHPTTLTAIELDRRSLMGDTRWLRHADYGLFIHWNSFSLPHHPHPPPPPTYQEAVAAFDVEAFASMCAESGAEFVVLTTTWAGYDPLGLGFRV